MNAACWQGEAPGRLDVLGGVADYSGALVLQTPIQATTRVRITSRAAPGLTLQSDHEGTIELPPFDAGCPPTSGDTSHLRDWLEGHRVPTWARYPIGCLWLYAQAQDWTPPAGLQIAIHSDVPIGMGVSSSAALEVATLRALEACAGRRFAGTALARLAQRAENEVVGAPCGLMDQLAAAHGSAGALLPILCRPDLLSDPIFLPEGVRVVGWPSGVKHAVTDSPYSTARAAAFMGKRILEEALRKHLEFLTDLSPSVVRSISEAVLPHTLRGDAFLARHGSVDDPLSRIDPDRTYPIRAAATFPIEEHFRSGIAVQLLRAHANNNPAEILPTIGELMLQAHAGYTAIGLGCPETDAMVDAIRALGPDLGFFGARVSGGGSGGTVAVLLCQSAVPELERLARSLTPGVALIL
jgi:L-arabinokinase